MAIAIRTPSEDQWPEMFRIDARGFGFVPDAGDLERRRPIIDLSRFRIAVERGHIVGVAGSYGFDMTLPGGTTVPGSGITWVSVAATHRRQGILTQLMDACHADADERGEPVATLFASEGGIYERFGYGIATELRGVAIDRPNARFRPGLKLDRRAVRFIDNDEALDHRERLWEPARRQRAGEVSRNAAWHQFLSDIWARPQGPAGPAFCLAHADGYVVYRITEKWAEGGPQHRLDVLDFVALTPKAHLDLWHTVTGVDLVVTIGHRSMPVDDPLPYYFTDNRVVHTTSLKDGLWANVRDVAVCFGARTYGTADRLVVEVAGKRWAIEGNEVESSCRPVRTRADLVVDHSSLGALLFGGIRPSQLLAAGRITVRSVDVARRANAFFQTWPAPHCQTHF
jgi:predicted acetyltransferase